MASLHNRNNIQQDPHGKENAQKRSTKTIALHHHNQQKVNLINHQQHHQDNNIKAKRPTLAVLSNVEHVVRGGGQQQGKITAFGKQIQQHNKLTTRGNVDKQAFTSIQQQQQQQKIKNYQSTAITTRATTKSFAVYEDLQKKTVTAAATSGATSKNHVQSKVAANFDKKSSSSSLATIEEHKTIKSTTTTVTTTTTTKTTEYNQSCTENVDDNLSNTSMSAIRDPLKDITIKHDHDLIETPMSITEASTSSPMSIDKTVSSIEKFDLENIDINKSIIDSGSKQLKDLERLFEVDEYQLDILDYYKEVEKKHRPKPGYMRRQPDINNSMRTILVDWLVEVAEEYRLHTETLYLAISYVDRFLSYMSVVRAKLQLVGTAAMFIAAKYEEIYPPDVGEFVFITDDTYTKAQVLRMEQIILKILSFDLNVPSPLVFLKLFSILNRMPDQVKYLAFYLSELTLLESEPYLQYLPSQISSAALALSRHMLDLPIWSQQLEFITKYSLNDLKDIILSMCQSHQASVKLTQQAIKEKYKSNKYMQVSSIKPIELDEDQLDYLIKEYNNSKNIITFIKELSDDNSDE